MKTVNEVKNQTGISVRTLHYYDTIGLLHPTMVTASGYRLYDDGAVARLQKILLYRSLGFSLKEVGDLLDSEESAQQQSLEEQIERLLREKSHLERCIDLARGIQITGGSQLDFTAFDANKLESPDEQAKVLWGNTEAYRQFEEKQACRTSQEETTLQQEMMELFCRFGEIRQEKPDSEAAQSLVETLRQFITSHFYDCTVEVFSGLGELYRSGGAIAEAIDEAGDKGTAEFVAKAIAIYCEKIR